MAARREEMHDAIVDFCAANNGETRIMAQGSGGERLDSFEGAPSPAEKGKTANKIDEWAAKIPRNAQGRSDVSGMAPESIDLGRVLENHRLALGIRPEDARICLSIPGGRDFGIKHWLKNHADTLRGVVVIDLLERTIWNPAAAPIEEISGSKRRLVYEVKSEDKNVSAVLFELIDDKKKDKRHWELVDTWEPSDEYMERRQKK